MKQASNMRYVAHGTLPFELVAMEDIFLVKTHLICNTVSNILAALALKQMLTW